MAEATSKTAVVRQGSRVRIVFHGYFEGQPLAGRAGYGIGTEHDVTLVQEYGMFLNDDTWVLPEEIEVINE